MAGLSKVKGSGLATGAATASLVGIDDNATSTAITIDASENVGIGTLSPNYKLKIVGGADILNLENTSASSYEHLRFTVGSANARIIMTGESFGDANYGQGDLTLQTETSGGKIRFGTGASGVNKMIIGDDGISFNGDTAAANALDDYEEGTWTPALRGNVTAGNTTYVSRYGTYEKIGRTVHFRGTIHVNAQGTLNGLVYITGLPFTSQATSPTSSFYIGYAGSLSITASESLTGTVQNNSTEGLLRVWNSSGGTSNFDDAELTDSAQLYFGGTYNVG